MFYEIINHERACGTGVGLLKSCCEVRGRRLGLVMKSQGKIRESNIETDIIGL